VTARYTGRLTRNDDGTLVWSIADSWGWVITGIATKDAAGGYAMAGELGPTPEQLQLPGEDEFRNPVGKVA
jgi:hypothetical protein